MKEKKKYSFKRFALQCLTWLTATVLILCAGLYGVMYIFVNGPSNTAKTLFIRSVRETSALYWLADIFCTEEEIAQIEHIEPEENLRSDVSFVITKPEEKMDTGNVDAWGLKDEDGDGIIIENVKGPGYVGYMMIVQDSSRIIMGKPDYFGGNGLSTEEMCRKYDCIAGINGGGFHDPEGAGNGGQPVGMTVVDGQILYAYEGGRYPFVGFDTDGILHTGYLGMEDVAERKIRFGCTFGPVLICNGERSDDSVLSSGVNPRTAIGQRSDGAVLMLVVDGRQAHSLGATYADMADIMESFGAVNACNLDGGSSTAMWFRGDYVNRCAWVIGARPTATAFLVKEAAA